MATKARLPWKKEARDIAFLAWGFDFRDLNKFCELLAEEAAKPQVTENEVREVILRTKKAIREMVAQSASEDTMSSK